MIKDALALDLIAAGFAQLHDGLEKLRTSDEWVSQRTSPLGKLGHLAAVRRGDLVGRKVGKLMLVKREELDAYIEKHRTVRKAGPADPKDDEEREIDAILNAEPKRRRRAV